MNAMMGGTHYHTPQTVFQHMLGGNQNAQDSPQWMQIPQVPPISMPWVVQSSEPNVITFGADRPQPTFGLNLHQKRKLDPVDMLEMRQPKQFITEEKMAAHFRELHISTADPSTSEPGPSTSAAFDSAEICTKISSNIDTDMDGPTIVEIDSEQANGTPRLVMSEELKRLQQEPILPSSLLSRLERPSMALVLWEPPNKHLRLLPSPRDTPTLIPGAAAGDNNNNSATVGDNNNINNNNEGIPNLNVMSEDFNEPALEPMDL